MASQEGRGSSELSQTPDDNTTYKMLLFQHI
jgi:hypothetical protein